MTEFIDPNLATGETHAFADIERAIAERGYTVQYFEEKFGLGLAEISQHVEWGPHSGPLFEALIPPPTPAGVTPDGSPPKSCMGNILEKMYQKGGHDAVVGKINSYMEDDDKPHIYVSSETKRLEDQKWQARPSKTEDAAAEEKQRPSPERAEETKSANKRLPEAARPVIKEVINRSQQVSDAVQESVRNHPSNPPQASDQAIRFKAHTEALKQQDLVSRQAAEQPQAATLVMERPMPQPKTELAVQTTAPAIVVKSKVEKLGDKDSKVVVTAFEPAPLPIIESPTLDEPVEIVSTEEMEEAGLLEAVPSNEEQATTLEAASVLGATMDGLEALPETEPEAETAPAPAITIKVIEMVQLPEEKAEEVTAQVQNLTESMPVIVAEQLELFLDTAEPEEVAAVAETIAVLATVADRLHVLSLDNKLDSEEAQQIELFIEQQYEQLLTIIGLEAETILIEAFIAAIKAADYKQLAEAQPEDVKNYMHESIQKLLATLTDGFDHPTYKISLALGRYLMKLSAE